MRARPVVITALAAGSALASACSAAAPVTTSAARGVSSSSTAFNPVTDDPCTRYVLTLLEMTLSDPSNANIRAAQTQIINDFGTESAQFRTWTRVFGPAAGERTRHGVAAAVARVTEAVVAGCTGRAAGRWFHNG